MGRWHTRHHSVQAFTLVELVVVLAIMATLAATAMWSVRLPLVQAKTQYAIEQVISLDAFARQRSRNQRGGVSLSIDPDENSVRLYSDSAGLPIRQISLPKGIEIVEVMGTRRRRGEPYRINFDRFGASVSYSVHISPSQSRRSSRSLLVLGLTGQTYIFEDDSVIRQVLFGRGNFNHGAG